MQKIRTRPIKANDPEWVVVDLDDWDQALWRRCIAAARSRGMPVAVWIREALHAEMARLEAHGDRSVSGKHTRL